MAELGLDRELRTFSGFVKKPPGWSPTLTDCQKSLPVTREIHLRSVDVKIAHPTL